MILQTTAEIWELERGLRGRVEQGGMTHTICTLIYTLIPYERALGEGVKFDRSGYGGKTGGKCYY